MDNWHVIEEEFDPKNLRSWETIFTSGNGYLGTRGSYEEGYPGDQPATLINGFYDEVPIVYSELVNTPNWMDMQVIANGVRFRLEKSNVNSYNRELNLHNGVITRKMIWQVPSGGEIELIFERFASLADDHVLGLRCKLRSLSYTGKVEFHASIPGTSENDGYVHLDWRDQGLIRANCAFIELTTRKSHTNLVEAFNLELQKGNLENRSFLDCRSNPTLTCSVNINTGEDVIIEKLVSVYTSIDMKNPRKGAIDKLKEITKEGFSALLAASETEWDKYWQNCNITIDGDDHADLAVRHSLFQLLIAAPRKNERVSIPAKSLSGFGYHGHVFWDTEIFILPFFIYSQPEIARRLIMYRYHTLEGARRKAKQSGFEGAQFAWESAATGDENTPRWVPLPNGELVRIWCGDIEHHISADIVYAINQYWNATGDDDFIRDYGAEIVLDTARFWGSRVEWNASRNRYEINDVIGPDEYHDHINNNAYTNNMVRWSLQTAIKVLDWLRNNSPDRASELEKKYKLDQSRIGHWQNIISHIYLGFDPKTGLYEQFEGFFQRKPADLKSFEPRTKSMQALLGIEKTQEHQILKQPDVLMLLYLMGKKFNPQIVKRNFDYYTPRTDLTYGSSLGPSIQSIMATWTGDINTAYELFHLAADTDLDNVRGNSSDGIHAATDGGLWQGVIFGFAGLEMSPNGPVVDPNLPPHWKRVRFRVNVKGKLYDFDVQQGKTKAKPCLPLLGAIFDLDGVLTDTSELHYQAWKRLADEEGIPFNREENESLRGIPRRESLLMILKGRIVPEDKIVEMMEKKNRSYVESISSLTPKALLPGAKTLLEQLHKAGIKIALGSASKNAPEVIDKLGIKGMFDAITSGSSVMNQKPAPDLFLNAAELLKIPANQCVVFEDATAGIEAALAGGMWAIGIGPINRLPNSHIVFSSLAEVSLENVLKQLSSLSG